MIPIEVSGKSLVFIIEALEQHAASKKHARTQQASDDEISDLQNDISLLGAILQDLKHMQTEAQGKVAEGDVKKRTKIKLIIQCLYSEGFSETEQDALINMGNAASPDPSWTDYIYWPSRFGLDGSIEATLDKIFSYKPILL
jgi:hypothetical protein